MTNDLDLSDCHAAITEAFATSIAALERLLIPITDQTKERLTMAILDLARAGQRDAEALSRYAVSRIKSGP